MPAGRIPCINPRCRRTADASKYEGDPEIICGKCFRALPEAPRKRHQDCWRELRKWERRITRTSDELKLTRMRAIRDMWSEKIHENWELIRNMVANPEKPEGLDGFLKEVGL